MSVTRDFDAMLADQAGARPTFKVGGQEFTLRSRLPWNQWNKLLHDMRDDELDQMEQTERFFNRVLVKADRQRFLDLLHFDEDDELDDDDSIVDMSQMDKITDWALEHFTGKHLSSTDSSSPGVNGTGAAPNVVSLQSKKAANN